MTRDVRKEVRWKKLEVAFNFVIDLRSLCTFRSENLVIDPWVALTLVREP